VELEEMIELMEAEGRARGAPVLGLKGHLTTPFRGLVFVLLSSRTKDETTARVTRRLFAEADTPEEIARLGEDELAELIYPVGFYRTKARNLRKLARMILRDYRGEVPQTFGELLNLPGIGRKSARVLLANAFNQPFIGVDTHVHRISNRLGLVSTGRVEETEVELEARVEESVKARLNRAFVAFGQTVCRPQRPLCPECPLRRVCPKIGVKGRK